MYELFRKGVAVFAPMLMIFRPPLTGTDKSKCPVPVDAVLTLVMVRLEDDWDTSNTQPLPSSAVIVPVLAVPAYVHADAVPAMNTPAKNNADFVFMVFSNIGFTLDYNTNIIFVSFFL